MTRGVPPPDGDPDAGVAWHYGDPHGEQRMLASGRGAVDLSHFDVVTITGPDRLTWLHALTTQHLERLEPGGSALALILSPHGHVEYTSSTTGRRRGSSRNRERRTDSLRTWSP